MALDITKSVEIIEIMENYISRVRPSAEIRNKLDLNYEIKDQSVILNEIRPVWNNPKEISTLGYAKATYVIKKNKWKVYWMRADCKWHAYDPKAIVKNLKDFLTLVDEDQYGCFKG